MPRVRPPTLCSSGSLPSRPPKDIPPAVHAGSYTAPAVARCDGAMHGRRLRPSLKGWRVAAPSQLRRNLVHKLRAVPKPHLPSLGEPRRDHRLSRTLRIHTFAGRPESLHTFESLSRVWQNELVFTRPSNIVVWGGDGAVDAHVGMMLAGKGTIGTRRHPPAKGTRPRS